MIFVTVGTHEQSFNRLIKEIDRLVGQRKITESVFIQIGYSTYIPHNVEYKRFLDYEEMETKIDYARVVITHGGPASFLNVLSKGKVPVVVPRLKKFNEHVNDHQMNFARQLVKKGYNIIIVENIEELSEKISQIKEFPISYHSNNGNFMAKFTQVVDELFE